MNPAEFLHPQDKAEKARKTFAEAETDTLPVVNEKGVLLGVLLKEALPATAKKPSLWSRLTK